MTTDTEGAKAIEWTTPEGLVRLYVGFADKGPEAAANAQDLRLAGYVPLSRALAAEAEVATYERAVTQFDQWLGAQADFFKQNPQVNQVFLDCAAKLMKTLREVRHVPPSPPVAPWLPPDCDHAWMSVAPEPAQETSSGTGSGKLPALVPVSLSIIEPAPQPPATTGEAAIRPIKESPTIAELLDDAYDDMRDGRHAAAIEGVIRALRALGKADQVSKILSELESKAKAAVPSTDCGKHARGWPNLSESGDYGTIDPCQANFEFIAAANPQTVLALVEVVRAARRLREGLAVHGLMLAAVPDFDAALAKLEGLVKRWRKPNVNEELCPDCKAPNCLAHARGERAENNDITICRLRNEREDLRAGLELAEQQLSAATARASELERQVWMWEKLSRQGPRPFRVFFGAGLVLNVPDGGNLDQELEDLCAHIGLLQPDPKGT